MNENSLIIIDNIFPELFMYLAGIITGLLIATIIVLIYDLGEKNE